MKKQSILYTLFFLLLASGVFSSCVKDDPAGSRVRTDGRTVLRVPFTRSGDSFESNVTSWRVIIFSTDGQLLLNRSFPGGTAGFETEVRAGYLDLYLVANEPASWQLDNIATAGELKRKALTFGSYPAVDAGNPVPMFGQYEWLHVDRDGLTTLNGVPVDLADPGPAGNVERLYAKVNVKLNCDYGDLPGNTPVLPDGISVSNMPGESYLSPAKYVANGFFNGATIDAVEGTDYFLKQSGGVTTGFTADFTLYVPEYIVSDASKPCYITVRTRLASDPSSKMKYTLVLGDGMVLGNDHMKGAAVTREDLTVSRNTLYTYDIKKFTGYGEFDPLQIYTSVKPWEGVAVNNELGQDKGLRRLNVSAVKTDVSEIYVRRVYFWSNQKEVTVKPTFRVSGGLNGTFNVNDYFRGLTDAAHENFHYTWDDASGTGSGYIDLKPYNNIPSGSHEFGLVLDANGLEREITLAVNVPRQWSAVKYRGTYHRGSETGERIIYSGHTGAWKATVENSLLTGAFVVLSTEPTQDLSVRTDYPLDPELFPVSGTAKTVSGTGNIFFRVGLTSTTPVNRYARIKVEWQDLSQTSYIYVRQGSSPAIINTNPTTPVMWATYNADTSKPYNYYTDYPTQVGKMYQWGKDVFYNPADPPGNVWDPAAKTTLEKTPCFPGYTYPSNTQVNELYDLLLFPNLVRKWGYYADGYFDRLKIDETTNTVRGGTNGVASAGIIYGNTLTNICIFLPAGGSRTAANGSLDGYQGVSGYYWTRTYDKNFYSFDGDNFHNGSSTASSAALTVRCVVQ